MAMLSSRGYIYGENHQKMVIWDLNLQSSPSEWPCSSAEMFSAEIQPDLH